MNKEKHTKLIKAEAQRLGFFDCGISRATFLEQEAPKLEEWLKKGRHGEMGYMENHFDKRLDPRLLVDGAKSVISVLCNYYPEEKQQSNKYIISKYAYGKDYHFVIKEKLSQLIDFISQNIGEVNARAFTDSAPVLDRSWATLSGLGWIGKNSCLINKKQGSFFFVAEIICDLELEYDTPTKSFCGNCTRCIDACPTGAILQPYVIDSKKCISYLTIEYKDKLPKELREKFNDRVFGCDICQDVCPHNRKAKAHTEPAFTPHPKLLTMQNQEWENLDRDTFNEIFRKSSVKRAKFTGLRRNIDFLKEEPNE